MIDKDTEWEFKIVTPYVVLWDSAFDSMFLLSIFPVAELICFSALLLVLELAGTSLISRHQTWPQRHLEAVLTVVLDPIYHTGIEMDSRPCDPSSVVQFSMYVSFELDPMLSHGEVLHTFNMSVGELLDCSKKSHCQ